MGMVEENKLLKETFEKIVALMKESNVYPATNCKLFLEDGVKVVKIIEECERKLQNNKQYDIM